MLPFMGGFKKLAFLTVALACVLAFGPAPPAKADVVFRATCGDLKGSRVDMDPENGSKPDKWKSEHYPAGPPPEGTGALKFVSDDTDTGHVRMSWTANSETLLPVVFKSDTQITVADVDDFGVWLFTLYYRAGKVIVTRQTTNPGPGAIGALLVGECKFKGK